MLYTCTAVSSEAWAKLREWAILAGKGRLLLSGSVVLASLKAPVHRRLSLTVICSVEHIVRSHLATQSAVFRPKKDVRITLASFQLQGKWDSEADTLVVGLGHIDSVETKDWNMEDKTTPNSH